MHKKKIIKKENEKFTKFLKKTDADKHKIENNIMEYEKKLNLIKMRFSIK